jgi:hypothetical protein
MQDRCGWNRAIGVDVVPKFRQIAFVQKKSGLVSHGFSPFLNFSSLIEAGYDVLGRKQKRPSQTWDGRWIRGATQLRLMQLAGQPHSI